MSKTAPRPGFIQRCSLFGVPLHTSDHLYADLTAVAHGETLALLMTPNPEIYLRTLEQPAYAQVLRAADIALPDGTGLYWATTFLQGATGKKTPGILWAFVSTYASLLFAPGTLRKILPCLHKGSDTFFGLHDFWQRRGASPRVFYFGGEGDVPTQILSVMQAKYPALTIAGASGGYPYRSPEEFDALLRTITAAEPEVVFVAMPNPKQEQWMLDTRHRLEQAGVRLVCGFGGTFDFAVGKRRRAPLWMQRSGLEWVYRLLQEPQRFGRILRAVIVFPLRTLQRRLAGLQDLEMD